MKTGGLMKTIRAILLLGGAFTSAFLWGEMVHDSGHYVCHLVYGNQQVGVDLILRSERTISSLMQETINQCLSSSHHYWDAAVDELPEGAQAI